MSAGSRFPASPGDGSGHPGRGRPERDLVLRHPALVRPLAGQAPRGAAAPGPCDQLRVDLRQGVGQLARLQPVALGSGVGHAPLPDSRRRAHQERPRASGLELSGQPDRRPIGRRHRDAALRPGPEPGHRRTERRPAQRQLRDPPRHLHPPGVHREHHARRAGHPPPERVHQREGHLLRQQAGDRPSGRPRPADRNGLPSGPAAGQPGEGQARHPRRADAVHGLAGTDTLDVQAGEKLRVTIGGGDSPRIIPDNPAGGVTVHLGSETYVELPVLG